MLIEMHKTACDKAIAHHWIIESPAGPTSHGVCKFCGAEKDFVNSSTYIKAKDHHAVITATSAMRRERARSQVLPTDRSL